METPFTKIQKTLEPLLSADASKVLPEKWEKIGDVLILKLPEILSSQRERIGEVYAQKLKCKTVLCDVGGIMGALREPQVERIYGSAITETVHKENGIRYKLDPQKVMFSSGNMDERIRMGSISNSKECVVDLFAGIGYFTLPIALYSKPQKIFACELNPVAFDYLEQNIVLNHVSKIVAPLLGDNRVVAPKKCADRVILGYIHGTHHFLPVALSCLKSGGGVVHYHDVFADEEIPDTPFSVVQDVVSRYNRTATLLEYHHIKSFAPGLSHIVLDVKIR
jgi:tRNA wybutosine-synthesizing protein 2